jgi:hypothetical protein
MVFVVAVTGRRHWPPRFWGDSEAATVVLYWNVPPRMTRIFCMALPVRALPDAQMAPDSKETDVVGEVESS